VVVSVVDSGVGIPPDAVPRVFEEFWQVNPRSPLRQGGGLGLAICKRFVELHGGSIWATSEVGVGSTFSFSLPLSGQVIARPWEDNRDGRLADRNGAARRVVVLGEDEAAARTLRRYLDGFEVLVAANADEARPSLASGAPHAVVVTSPSGQEELRRLQGAEALPARMPIIRCSLRTGRDAADSLGVAQYLVKPVMRDQLVRALGRLARRPRRALVVDDEPEMARLLARMIRSCAPRCRVVSARDGVEALALLRAQPPDVVFLDLLMPGLTGYEVLEQMRGDACLGAIPVVVVSAHGNEDEGVTCEELAISRAGGLSVGEMAHCLKSSIGALRGGEE
jgi:CheY-like chemotaxis protein